MNTDFSTAKEHFIEKGYCQFSLKDFDIDFYDFLNEYLSCDESNNLKNVFNEFRFDSDKIEIRYKSPTNSWEDAKSKELELFDKYYDNSDISQCWYFTNDFNHIYNFLQSKHPNLTKENLRLKTEKIINKIISYFYDYSSDSELYHNELQFTYYDLKGRFTPHSDGMTVNLCSIIIYLNKDYKKENGGLLLLNKEEIVPELGTVALMDLSKHDINHGVTEVTSGPGRYAILSFPKLKPTI
jgi:hypothetical protein